MNAAGHGGVAARRAVARWAIRLFRRDWRQQRLIVVLLTVAVASTVFAVSAVFNMVPSRAGEFGRANYRLPITVTSASVLPDVVRTLEGSFGDVEVIGHGFVPVPGALGGTELRQQDPAGRFSEPMLALVRGRYPHAATEVAVTDGAAELLGVTGPGTVVELAGVSVTVVGVVENPAKLADEFVLVAPETDLPVGSYEALVTAARSQVAQLPASAPVAAAVSRPACHAALICFSSGQSEQATAAAAALAVATVFLGLVGLVTVAGFVVIAQRRLRQLGMFLANGATHRHLRFVMLVNGAVVGALAATVGSLGGIAGWILVAPHMEQIAGRRIDAFHLPAVLVAGAWVLTVVTAVTASSKPARMLAHLPIMAALSARPTAPTPARRSLVVAVVLVAGAILALSRSIDRAADTVNPALLITGIAALVIGAVFLAPNLLAAMGRAAVHVPVASRIALRDLSRYRARSALGLAAIGLAIAIPATVIVIAAANRHAATDGNLSDRELLVRIGDDPLAIPARTPAELGELRAVIDTIAASVTADTTPLQVAVDPAATTSRGNEALQPVVVLARRVDDNTSRDLDVLYLATPRVLAITNRPADAADQTVDVLTAETGTLVYANTAISEPPTTATIAKSDYSSEPGSFITPAGLQRRGWSAAPAGWLLRADQPVTSDERQQLRDLAGRSGLTVEFRDQQATLGAVQTAATIAGIVLALTVLALTLGLIRAETGNEIRILTAAGATGRIRRRLHAATSAALAAAGAFLGIALSCAALAATYGTGLGDLHQPPLLQLALLAIGVPAAAATAAWLLGGREPATLTRSTPS